MYKFFEGVERFTDENMHGTFSVGRVGKNMQG